MNVRVAVLGELKMIIPNPVNKKNRRKLWVLKEWNWDTVTEDRRAAGGRTVRRYKRFVDVRGSGKLRINGHNPVSLFVAQPMNERTCLPGPPKDRIAAVAVAVV